MLNARSSAVTLTSPQRAARSFRAVCYGVPVISDLPLVAGTGENGVLQTPCHIVIDESAPPSKSAGQALIELEIQGHRVAARYVPGQGSELQQGAWRAFVENVARFEWREGVDEPLHIWSEGASEEVLAFWVVHLILPAFLSSTRGITFLHASAVQLDGGCVAFLGPSNSGKSTLLASFLKRGFALYSDDKLAIRQVDGDVVAFAAHERYRPYRAVESLGRCRARRIAGPGSLRALLALERDPDLVTPRIQRIEGAGAFRRLLADHHMGFWQTRSEKFHAVSHLSRNVPLASLAIPDKLHCLPAVTEAVESFVTTL